MDKLSDLGKSGAKVAPIGLGCMGMSAFYGSTDEEESIKTLNRAIELGCTFWDTADIYGPCLNEELLAKVMPQVREKVFLCTKFGVEIKDRKFTGNIRGDAEYVKAACAASLERLGVDSIDLYYQHRVDAKTPIETTVGALAELVKEGKIKHIGLSEASADTIRKAHAVHPISALQTEYSPWTPDIETNGIMETCKELGIAIVAYSPLGRGFLAGKFQKPEDLEENDWRRTNPRFQGENFQKNLAIVDKIKELAATKGCTAGQLCLAWCVFHGTIPIPGTKRIKYLEENCAAATIEWTQDDEAKLRAIMKEIPAAGDRYDARAMASCSL
eukprot:NODE_313_length_1655_cov_72.800393_g281_i0.p1 GENE.NODE_313_length_1655_cov_72.800393_g281_i0~~NODE_313_length_1655_cov_72.800393_g281_i0.p1  ORF type:complete len:329 (+),score=83.82 NODE_313_length_1655_cov_72.800393_g281_i0:96-1082(+)